MDADHAARLDIELYALIKRIALSLEYRQGHSMRADHLLRIVCHETERKS